MKAEGLRVRCLCGNEMSFDFKIPDGTSPSIFLAKESQKKVCCNNCTKLQPLNQFELVSPAIIQQREFTTAAVGPIDSWKKFEQLRNGDFDEQIATELGVDTND